MGKDILVTGNEVFFGDDDIIVSKTNLKGNITYANKVFLDIAGFKERDVIGRPHSVIRHPDMPRCIFKLLWETIQAGTEIFAYVINRCKNGDHYWVYAHVTPSFGASGEIVGFHSNRRVPDREVLNETIIPLYGQLFTAEQQHQSRKAGLADSLAMVGELLAQSNMAYDEFIMTLGRDKRRAYR